MKVINWTINDVQQLKDLIKDGEAMGLKLDAPIRTTYSDDVASGTIDVLWDEEEMVIIGSSKDV